MTVALEGCSASPGSWTPNGPERAQKIPFVPAPRTFQGHFAPDDEHVNASVEAIFPYQAGLTQVANMGYVKVKFDDLLFVTH